LQGETGWVCEMNRKYDTAAKTAGILMVHCAGFDSVPVDIGTLKLKKDAANTKLNTIAAYRLMEGKMAIHMQQSDNHLVHIAYISHT
jgi:short subunit dehydrogenase-like uncharacterized protein